MKVAIVGSRGKTVDLEFIDKHIPKGATEIVSGGAIGIDACAKEYAYTRGLKLKEFLPKYDLYGKAAPIKRNMEIIEYADFVLFFWDQQSKGTKATIKACIDAGVLAKVFFV